MGHMFLLFFDDKVYNEILRIVHSLISCFLNEIKFDVCCWLLATVSFLASSFSDLKDQNAMLK